MDLQGVGVGCGVGIGFLSPLNLGEFLCGAWDGSAIQLFQCGSTYYSYPID